MCGISGWIDWQRDVSADQLLLAKMRDSLAHRGPDDQGAWVSQRAALLHRRLTVVDPAGGAQPMVMQHQGRTLVLTYNGELYNTEDLRAELLAKGFVFRGYSDTEVLLAAYMAWGAECLPRLNGIFAFAVWDPDQEELFMARDRLGVKPLFYTRLETGLVFGSEIKALLAHPMVPREVGAEGLCEVLVMGPARTPGCGVLRGISDLRPGCFLRYDRAGLHVGRYWSLASAPCPDDLTAAAAKVRELLRDTVSRQLVSDVPVATLLSGGLDSSVLTALAADTLQADGRGQLMTFSVDYADQADHFQSSTWQPDDDAEWVAMVSRYVATKHTHIVLDTTSLAAALGDSMRANDLPGMADIDSSLLLFCREIKRHVTVALSGEAADEIFGGYPWFRTPDALSATTFPWALRARERAELLAPDLCQAIDPVGYVSDRYSEALAEVPRLPGEEPGEARLRELFYLNITRFMPTLLDRKDRMSMATGLEVRVPFCDHRLVEYAWNLPPGHKFANGREKGLLRLAADGLLPDAVIQRRKSPYPKTHDPAYAREAGRWLRERLLDPASPLRPLLSSERLNLLLNPTTGDAMGPSGARWFGQLMATPQFLAYLAQTDLWLSEYGLRVRL